MTTRGEVHDILANPESSTVEFKRDDIRPEQFAGEIVALLNRSGGRLLLGVEDDGTVSGITRTHADLEEWVMNVCRDKVRPPIIPNLEVVVDVEPGHDVAVVTVERGYAVHALWHNAHSRYQIRVGSQTREAAPDELQRLFQQRGTLSPELQPVNGADLASFDLRRLVDYFGRIRDQETPSSTSHNPWRELLVNTEFLATETDPPVATLAGCLIFAEHPQRFLPFARIEAAAYPGDDKEYETTERQSIVGPMTALGPADAPTEAGLVEKVLAFVQRNTPASSSVIDGQRVDRPTFPPDVVREAVVNAVVHRDYLLTATDVELSIYSDRLEIISPGRLPNGVTPDKMREGARAARNQLLKDTLRDYGYLENMGMGVRRKIVAGMLDHNGKDPDLIEDRDAERFTVRLWA